MNFAIFGPGKSWKLKLKVLESPGKISSKVIMHFPGGSNAKQAAIVWHPVCVQCSLLLHHILLHAEFSAVDYTLNTVSKCRSFFKYSKIRGVWKNFHGGPGKSRIFSGGERLGTRSTASTNEGPTSAPFSVEHIAGRQHRDLAEFCRVLSTPFAACNRSSLYRFSPRVCV